jgi:enoyl-[acyl-carrier protein] reductase II
MASIEPKLNRRAVFKLAAAAAVSGGAAMLSRSRAWAGRDSTQLQTRLSHELGLRVPLASAGMAFVSLAELTSAVSNAGALGVYGVGGEPPPVFAARLAAIQAQTTRPFGVDFILATSSMGPFTTQDHIDIAAAARVPIVVFHFGVPSAAWVAQLHAAGSKVWAQTGDVNVALQAVAAGADGIVAQGRSAGGHNRNATVPTLRVVERMRRALPPSIFVLASGGIADGDSLVRALRAGADGGWAGTAFVAATESYAHADYKARLVAAHTPTATQLTTVFGPEWPGQPQRVLRNRATTEQPRTTPVTIGQTTLFPGVLNVPYTMPKYSAIVPTRDTTGDLEEMDMPAGSRSVLAVRNIRPAAAIVDDFIDGARRALEHDARAELAEPDADGSLDDD